MQSIADKGISTIADYLLLEEGTRCQLINGELIVSPSPSTLHQRISRNLLVILEKYSRAQSGAVFYAPLDVYLDQLNVLQPDLLFLKESSLHKISERGIEGAPDLVVEILSPSNSYIDRYRKRDIYLRSGVKECWIIDPSYQSMEIHHLATDPNEPVFFLTETGIVSSPELENLQFDLAELWMGK